METGDLQEPFLFRVMLLVVRRAGMQGVGTCTTTDTMVRLAIIYGLV